MNAHKTYKLSLSGNQSCESKVIAAFEQSDELKLIRSAMKKFGCKFDLSRHVSCENCSQSCMGGFDPDTKQIIVCNNNLPFSKENIIQLLAHEMTHMFDYCRAKFDYDNIEHVACSEIRAANLTACKITDRFKYGGTLLWNFKKSHRLCVKDAAYESVKAYAPHKSPNEVVDVIEKVFDECYNDLEPFGRRPLFGRLNMKQSYRERYLFGYV